MTDTGESCAGVPENPDVVEEHVVLLDCGLAPTCDDITYILEATGGINCAQEHHATGEPGLVTMYQWLDGADDSDGPYGQDAFFFTPDRRVIRQSRGRGGVLQPEPCAPWDAWGPQEICDVVNGFDPETSLQNCKEVDDYTCAGLTELYNADPLPAVPCAERTEENCGGPISLEEYCSWRPEIATYSADSCEPVVPIGACIQGTYGSAPEECDLPSVCPGVEADSIVYRENDDGTVDIMNGYGCSDYEGFERCEWNEAGDMLVAGPPACDCACPGA